MGTNICPQSGCGIKSGINTTIATEVSKSSTKKTDGPEDAHAAHAQAQHTIYCICVNHLTSATRPWWWLHVARLEVRAQLSVDTVPLLLVRGAL